MEDIRTWIRGNRLYVFPDLAVSAPSKFEYLEWKSNETFIDHLYPSV
jgi:hypothetical protein